MFNPSNYLSEVRSELKRVVWPKRDQIMRLTFTVVAVSAIMGTFIGILDYVLVSATQYLI